VQEIHLPSIHVQDCRLRPGLLLFFAACPGICFAVRRSY
jgi:hypothetical protein